MGRTAPIIEMHITGERLMAMLDNGMDVYATPGSSEAYWASQPSFAYDQCVLTARAIIDEVQEVECLEEEEIRASETPITFLVELLEAR